MPTSTELSTEDNVYVENKIVTIYPRECDGYVELTKEDLLHLLKLIEETN